ncbi:MAG: SUF system NifU family Fe-S cluster assembly protein [Deltaproteobacteria bacterium]|nr:SUF system NifU family Fe-S cluster assembly protein [Deltaproteobacteria bacterium]
MSSDLRDLYQEMILDHNKRPRNYRALECATCHADGYNPLCGDQVTIYLDLEGGVVKDIGFVGSGCAISKASASMMTESLKGKTLAEVEDLFERFHQLVTGEPCKSCERAEAQPHVDLGKLEAFSGVSEYPARVKCATLPWHTLQAALRHEGAPVTTE